MFKGLSLQIGDVDGRILTLFSLWLGSIVARPTCFLMVLTGTQTLHFDLLYFACTMGYFFC